MPFISMARTRELIDSAANAHAAVVPCLLGRAAGMGWRASFCSPNKKGVQGRRFVIYSGQR